MLKIGPNKVAFSASFSLQPGESASIAPDVLPGVRVRFDAVDKEIDMTNPHGGIEVEKKGEELVVTAPFLKNGVSHSVELRDYLRSPAGNIAVRVVRASMGIAMFVHVDFIFGGADQAPNYGQR